MGRNLDTNGRPSRAATRRLKPWMISAVAPLLVYLVLDRAAYFSLRASGWFDTWEYSTRLDPKLGFSLRPLISNQFTKVAVATNEDGFRAAEAAGRFEPKRPGEVLIAAVGDSTTFGAFAPYVESYPSLLQEALRERLGRSVRVMNWGVPGYSTFQNASTVERMARMKPDIVIVTVNSFNDRAFVGRPDSYATFAKEFEVARPYQFHGFISYPLLYWHKNHVGPRLARSAAVPDLMAPLPVPRVPIGSYSGLLQQLRQSAANAGSKLVFITTGEGVDSPALDRGVAAFQERRWEAALEVFRSVHQAEPALFLPAYYAVRCLLHLGRSAEAAEVKRKFAAEHRDVDDRYMLSFSHFTAEYAPLLRSMATALGIPLIDFRSRFDEANIKFLDHGHFEPRGYRLMADELARVLTGMLEAPAASAR